MLSTSDTKPACEAHVGLTRRLRKEVGAGLEYLWELSGSLRLNLADAVLVEGTERETGLPMATFYFGHYDNFAFVLSRLYSEHQIVEKHTRINSLRVKQWTGRYENSADLLCVDVELLYCSMLRADGFLQIPQWIRQKYVIPDSWEKVLASFRRNTRKTDLRKVRKYGFTYQITKSDADFEHFYHHMYVPYLSKRFGDEVIIEPAWKVLRQCQKGELMHIVRDGHVVAAVLLHQLGTRLAYVWVGVPDDLDDELYMGAFSAMYYFTIHHGYSRGCEEIDFLGSRPLLNDGLFRYKRKWGTFVEDSPVPRGDILLKPLQFTAPVQSFFHNNKFIVRDGKDLVGKVLLNHEPATKEQVENLWCQYQTKGLRELRVFSLEGFDSEAYNWADDGSVSMRLIDLSDLPDPGQAFCRV